MPDIDAGPPMNIVTFPEGNEWSWNGGWAPGDGDFPILGLFDDEYGDGHAGTPVLPPGSWDWDDAANDLANWNNYAGNLGTFNPTRDPTGRQFGWRFVRVSDAIEYRDAAIYYEGSSGADYLWLGRSGSIRDFTQGNLGEGPDVLVFDASENADFRTGTTSDGGAHDDDLVIAGCNANTDGTFDILSTSLHAGPGRDWVFARDLSDVAIDLGDGDGLTDTLDALDGEDLVVLRGNTEAVRVFGGQGDDVFVWYVDDNIQVGASLGARFFGGGGWGDALFTENGHDRLVLAIPVDSELVFSAPIPAGAFGVRSADGNFVTDDATETYPRARHCIDCGTGPLGDKTVILEYESLDGTIHTGPVYLTSVEELQIGLGPDARIFSLDPTTGTATLMDGAIIYGPPEPPSGLCDE